MNESKATLCAKVLSIHVGRPRCFNTGDDADKPWTSGIAKLPVSGPVTIRQFNIEGDEQADLKHHGGPDKAVLAYPTEHYRFWADEFDSVDWCPGCFGENLPLEGCTESDVCIGDVFEFGDARLQVSQPRQPCWKLSRRWKIPKLAVRVQQTRRTGWYFRVLQQGVAEAGQLMRLIERPATRWTISVANEIMFAKPRDSVLDAELSRVDALSASWKETLSKRVNRTDVENSSREQMRIGQSLSETKDD